ncbi:MAG: hypothetical protein ACE5K4_09395, partial [Candidatus Hydrothermarchaeota archaeon]
MVIFNVKSRLERKIRLTEVQWAHTRTRHKEMDVQTRKMILTLEEPDLVYHSPKEENYHYYKLFRETPISEKYLLLIAKHLNGEGFVITAFFVSKIREKD